MPRPDAQRVVMAAQTVLRADGIPLLVDGVWGPRTAEAFRDASPLVKRAVTDVAIAFDYDIVDLISPGSDSDGRPLPVRVPNVSSEAARETLTRVAEEERVPLQLALAVCKLESNFNPNARSKTGYEGLMQLGTAAMTDVYQTSPAAVDWVDLKRTTRAGVSLFRMKYPYDVEQNSRVGCRYLKLVAQRMRLSISKQSDWPAIYMGYNIGTAAARAVVAGKLTEDVVDLIKVQAYANPGGPMAYAANLRSAFGQAVQAA